MRSLLLLSLTFAFGSCTNCDTTRIDNIFENYRQFSIQDVNRELVSEFLCNREYPLRYVNCYLYEDCGEHSAAFLHIRQEIINNLLSREGRCLECSPETKQQIRRIIKYVQKMPEWRLVLRKVQSEMEYFNLKK